MPFAQKTCEVCQAALRIVSTRDVTRKRYCSRRCRQLARYARGEMTEPLRKAHEVLRGEVRTFRASSPYRCKCCRGQYWPTSARQLWCTTCVPDKSSRARMRRYGISAPQYQLLLDAQDGHCRLCDSVGPLFIDHDHACCASTETCGHCIRGLLCNRCNVLIAVFERDPVWLAKVADYLRKDTINAISKP